MGGKYHYEINNFRIKSDVEIPKLFINDKGVHCGARRGKNLSNMMRIKKLTNLMR